MWRNPVTTDCVIVARGRSGNMTAACLLLSVFGLLLPISDYGEKQTGDFVTCFSVYFPSDSSRIIIFRLFSLNCLFSTEEKTVPFFGSGNNNEIWKCVI
jgi:hypothetical protein